MNENAHKILCRVPSVTSSQLQLQIFSRVQRKPRLTMLDVNFMFVIHASEWNTIYLMEPHSDNIIAAQSIISKIAIGVWFMMWKIYELRRKTLPGDILVLIMSTFVFIYSFSPERNILSRLFNTPDLYLSI